jgi:outer membrane lipoprotein-sorting protein
MNKWGITVLSMMMVAFVFMNLSSVLAQEKQNSFYMKFAEERYFQGKTVVSEFEVWYDKSGKYRMNTLSGTFVGDFEVWDGDRLYQYTKQTDQLLIRDLNPKDKPIPHLFLSSVIHERIKGDINSGKIKPQGEEFVSIYRFDGIPKSAKDKTLYKSKGNVNENRVILSDDESRILKSTTVLNNVKVHELKEIQYETNIDTSSDLFNVDTTIVGSVIELK